MTRMAQNQVNIHVALLCVTKNNTNWNNFHSWQNFRANQGDYYHCEVLRTSSFFIERVSSCLFNHKEFYWITFYQIKILDSMKTLGIFPSLFVSLQYTVVVLLLVISAFHFLVFQTKSPYLVTAVQGHHRMCICLT